MNNEKKVMETLRDECARMNTKSVLLDKANRLHKQAAALEALANSIAWDTLKPQVEELLWQYFVSH